MFKLATPTMTFLRVFSGRPVILAVGCFLHAVSAGTVAAADAVPEKMTFQTSWKGERIELPPGFAPKMTLKGIEEIRFAPGMFKAESDGFFSYIFVFSVAKEQVLTAEVIQREMLVYYQGLAESVLRGKGTDVDVGKFTFTLGQAQPARETPAKISATIAVTQYLGELNWVEPFVTRRGQLLHFEFQTWSDPSTQRNYLIVCASPKSPGGVEAGIWKELRGIRRDFEVSGG